MLGSVWPPIVFCLVMMAVCCGGALLVGRWRRAHRGPRLAPPRMSRMAAAGGGRKERGDG
jgi:hypothetical protein